MHNRNGATTPRPVLRNPSEKVTAGSGENDCEAVAEVIKGFEGKKPVTRQRLTKRGKAALGDYVKHLEALIGTRRESE